MGGSLAAACRKKFPQARITGVSRNQQAVRRALSQKWIHEASDLKKASSSADLIILCTPVDTLKPLLKKIEASARPGTLVTDVGSTKQEICSWARKNLKRISFTSAHPMTGSHRRGIEACQPGLYDKHLTFVIRSGASKGYTAVRDFWKKISGRIYEIDPVRHDRVTAEISHLPHASAVCLVASADSKSFPFAAGGFMDSTRIAQADPSVWVPIFISNRQALKPVFKRFTAQIKAFERLVMRKDEAGLHRFLARISKLRKALRA